MIMQIQTKKQWAIIFLLSAYGLKAEVDPEINIPSVSEQVPQLTTINLISAPQATPTKIETPLQEQALPETAEQIPAKKRLTKRELLKQERKLRQQERKQKKRLGTMDYTALKERKEDLVKEGALEVACKYLIK